MLGFSYPSRRLLSHYHTTRAAPTLPILPGATGQVAIKIAAQGVPPGTPLRGLGRRSGRRPLAAISMAAELFLVLSGGHKGKIERALRRLRLAHALRLPERAMLRRHLDLR